MKKEDFFELLGDVEQQYIFDAHKKKSGNTGFGWAKWSGLAACVAVLILCIPTLARLSAGTEDETVAGGVAVIENFNGTKGLQSNKEELGGILESPGEGRQETLREELQGALKEEPAGETVQENAYEGNPEAAVKDEAADGSGKYNEAVGSSDVSKETSAFFGGSYTDTDGRFVIVLTEDTPENRAAICKELGRKEDDTIFVKGTYTLAYLTELQAKISDGMIKKELPFVVSSGVYEITNNIIIVVTTEDETELEKVLELDTIGGAIQVELGTCGVEELQSK